MGGDMGGDMGPTLQAGAVMAVQGRRLKGCGCGAVHAAVDDWTQALGGSPVWVEPHAAAIPSPLCESSDPPSMLVSHPPDQQQQQAIMSRVFKSRQCQVLLCELFKKMQCHLSPAVGVLRSDQHVCISSP